MKNIPTLIVLIAGAALYSLQTHGATITLTGTVRDFHYNGTSVPPLAGHPDFENVVADDRGIVQTALGADGTPVYAHGASSTATVHGETGFNQWYHDAPGVNLSTPCAITLAETSPGIFSYQNSAFFPIDGQLGGNQGSSHNYSFTYQIHTTFTYEPGQNFGFTGDDDVWVFINKQRALDLGGVHGAETASINLDTLGLTTGGTYDFDFFFAERHTSGSDLMITTSIPLVSSAVPEASRSILLLGSSLTLLGLFVGFARRTAITR